jgi:hypothetical protein
VLHVGGDEELGAGGHEICVKLSRADDVRT